MRRKNLFKKIYIALVFLLTIVIIIVPKTWNNNNVLKDNVDIQLTKDKWAIVNSNIEFETRNILPQSVKIPLIQGGDYQNVQVYGNNIFGSFVIDTIYDKNSIDFFTSPIYSSYTVKYMTDKSIGKLGDSKVALKIPLNVQIIKDQKEMQIYNLHIKTVFPNNLPQDNATIDLYSLPANNSNSAQSSKTYNIFAPSPKYLKEVQNYEVVIMPKEYIQQDVYETLSEIELKDKEQIENQHNEDMAKYIQLKDKDVYSKYVYKKYILIALYLILVLQVLYYLLIILNSLKTRAIAFNEFNVREEKTPKIGLNLTKAAAFFQDKKINAQIIKNYITAIIYKLLKYDYIKVDSSDNIVFTRIDQEKISKLEYIDKYILEKIYKEDKKNQGYVSSKKLHESFKQSGEEICYKLYDQIEKQKLEFIQSGIYRPKIQRVDFSIIIVLILPIVILASYNYINPFLWLAIFFGVYGLSKLAVVLNVEGYTKKGINLKYNLEGYKRYLKSLTKYISYKKKQNQYKKVDESTVERYGENAIKIVDTNENDVYRIFFGIQKDIKKNKNQKMAAYLADAICTRIDFLGI